MAHPEHETLSYQSEMEENVHDRRLHMLGREAALAPLDADSLLLKYLGSNKMAFPGLAVGTLQLMHPAIGAGVDQHSTFFSDEWGRINRSLPLIYGAAYDEDAAETGHMVKEIHRNIKGTDERGRRYHALNPEVWHWAHATFFYGAMKVATKYSAGNLNEGQRARMYDESKTWYHNWGVSDRPLPDTFSDFKDYWDETCENTLEMTSSAQRAVFQTMGRQAPRPSFVPEQLWPFMEVPLMPVANHMSMLTIGELPPKVRERFHIPFSSIDKARLGLFRAAVRNLDHMPVPEAVMYHPRAHAGLKRMRAGQH